MEKVFLNDKLIDKDKALISADDTGFLYGAGLFETMPSYNGTVFALDNHLERLFISASALSMPNPYEKKYFTDAIYELLKANKLTNARIRLTLTGGAITQSEEKRKPTLLITATKLQLYPDRYYQKGILVVLCPFRQNPSDPTTGHKTTNYLNRMMALQLSHQKRAAEAVWFTTDNRLAEGSISNIFLVKGASLYSPKLDTPVLSGVTRKIVILLAKDKSIKILEKDLSIDDLLGADEIFFTNSIMKIMPVTAVEKHIVGDGKVGPVTIKLIKSYNELIEKECGKTK